MGSKVRSFEPFTARTLDFFKLHLVMFFEGIRSERQLLAVAADRLSVRWYLGYDLDEPLPDHSSLTRIRDRYGIDALRRFFDHVVALCQQAGRVWGRELYLDATQVAANASLDSLAPRFAVEAHLATVFASDANVVGALDALSAYQETSAPIMLPTAKTDLATTNAVRHDWLAAGGQPDWSITRSGYQRRSDFKASRTDPDVSLMYRAQTSLRVGYHDHYVVDGGTACVILVLYDAEQDVYYCPEGQPLTRFARRSVDGSVVYYAGAATCNACPVKAASTSSERGRTIQRAAHAIVVERVQTYQDAGAYQKAIGKRRVWVEPPFGEAKQWHGLEQFRLRGLPKVTIEALLVTAGQNLKRLVSRHAWLGTTTVPRWCSGSQAGCDGTLSRHPWRLVIGLLVRRAHWHVSLPASLRFSTG